MGTLSRVSHDTDLDVALCAVISLGLIGAGTNNAWIAHMLRDLSSFYYDEPIHLFVRIAQGLVHLGKGLLTLAPYHSDRFILSPQVDLSCWHCNHAVCMSGHRNLGIIPSCLLFSSSGDASENADDCV